MRESLVCRVQSIQPSRLLECVQEYKHIVHAYPNNDKDGNYGEKTKCLVTEENPVDKQGDYEACQNGHAPPECEGEGESSEGEHDEQDEGERDSTQGNIMDFS